jgi:hypothetical protein
MAKKKLCPLCKTRSSGRYCPVREDEICTKCCGMNRTSEECDESCVFYKPVASASEMDEELPIYKVLKSNTEGSYVIIASRERTDGKLQFIAVLIDTWKMGLKNCFGSHNITKNDFQKKLIKNWGRLTNFGDITLSDALWYIKYGLRIAKEVKTDIPWEFDEYKYILGNMDSVKVEGSLYKCFKCGKGELPEDVVEMIKEVTLHDMSAHVCGTPAESMIYFTCDKCK